jgi:hypothetical protein
MMCPVEPVKPMRLTERFEMFCRFCYRKFEDDTIHSVLSKVINHEEENHQ